MKLTFLGTSAGTPTRDRNVTAQALTLDHGAIWLLDCGEATQHQFMRAGLKPGRCERILITHLHGDHVYGLPGMLSCIDIHERHEPLEIIGPVGIRELLTTVLRISEVHLSYTVHITEITSDGQAFAELAGWQVAAYPLSHRVNCWGYVLREGPRPGRFHPERAQQLGIPEGPLYRQLQNGDEVRLADGRIIAPLAVTDPPRPGRVIVLLGDTSDPSAIATAAHGCDLLVCETTYDATRTAKAQEWGHSTTAMTGGFAAKIAAKTLIITHFSSRYTEQGSAHSVADLLAETRAACPDTQVLAAADLWSHVID